MKLRLIRNQDAFSIITETAGQYKIKVLDLCLVIRKIKPGQNVFDHHQRLWKSQNAVFQFPKCPWLEDPTLKFQSCHMASTQECQVPQWASIYASLQKGAGSL